MLLDPCKVVGQRREWARGVNLSAGSMAKDNRPLPSDGGANRCRKEACDFGCHERGCRPASRRAPATPTPPAALRGPPPVDRVALVRQPTGVAREGQGCGVVSSFSSAAPKAAPATPHTAWLPPPSASSPPDPQLVEPGEHLADPRRTDRRRIARGPAGARQGSRRGPDGAAFLV